MVQEQWQCGVYFFIKIFFKSWFVWRIWPFECLILMILTMTKHHDNLLRDSTLCLLFIVIFFFFLWNQDDYKIPNETLLRITRYIVIKVIFQVGQVSWSIYQKTPHWTHTTYFSPFSNSYNPVRALAFHGLDECLSLNATWT